MHSATLLARLSTHYQAIDLSIRSDYTDLLRALGDPHLHLPPTIHVAGTNGKGSTIAFMRAICEAAGLATHVYTSPHLVHFHERIRLAGQLITEDYLVTLLQKIEANLGEKKLTQFEITTIAAFLAFAETPADILLLETGMGGRLDATNILSAALATCITRISHDHSAFLGDNLRDIAAEKAGIFKKDTPAVTGPQMDETVAQTFIAKAAETGAPLCLHGRDWDYMVHSGGFRMKHGTTMLDLPPPALHGPHQYANAATAVAALLAQKQFSFSPAVLAEGLQKAAWPARLQRLTKGPLLQNLPPDWELWLDGGHNDSAGEALAEQAKAWAMQDDKPLALIYGMINTKNPAEFLAPLRPHIAALCAIPIPEEDKSLSAEETAEAARRLGISPAWACRNAQDAQKQITVHGKKPARILITGSLYLAGFVLRDHG